MRKCEFYNMLQCVPEITKPEIVLECQMLLTLSAVLSISFSLFYKNYEVKIAVLNILNCKYCRGSVYLFKKLWCWKKRETFPLVLSNQNLNLVQNHDLSVLFKLSASFLYSWSNISLYPMPGCWQVVVLCALRSPYEN